MQNLVSRSLRNTAFVLSGLLLFNQLSYAADMPASLPDMPMPQVPRISAQTGVQTNPSQPPVPSAILNGKTVFIVNAGSGTGFPAGPDAAYTQFYNDMKEWGRYELVDTPAAADMIFQLRSAAPIGGVYVVDGTGQSYRSPMLFLTIIDPKTQVPLWTLSQPFYTALWKKDRTDWISLSVMNVVSRVKLLTGDRPDPGETAALNESPKYHHSKKVWLWLLVPAAIAGGTTAIIIHENNAYNNFKTQNGLTCATNPFFCTNP